MKFVQSTYRGAVSPSFDFVPNEFDVTPFQKGTIEQEGETLLHYMVSENRRLTTYGVTVSKERCVELLRPVLGDVELHLNHSVYHTDFPLHVTLDMVMQSGLTFKANSSSSFHVSFEDLKVKVLFGKNALTMIPKFHPEMDSEEQVTESHNRLLATFA